MDLMDTTRTGPLFRQATNKRTGETRLKHN